MEANIPLKHERQAPIPDLLRLQLRIARSLKGSRVRSVSAHDIVQTCTCGLETPACLRVVVPADQTHELGHRVAVIPRRTEGPLCDQPARREDNKVRNSGAHMV